MQAYISDRFRPYCPYRMHHNASSSAFTAVSLRFTILGCYAVLSSASIRTVCHLIFLTVFVHTVCLSVCHYLFVWLGLFFVYVDTVYGFYGYSLLCLVGCFSMIIWTPTVSSVLYSCVSYFCICTCSAQLSMFHMEWRSRNMLIINYYYCPSRIHHNASSSAFKAVSLSLRFTILGRLLRM